MKLPERPPRIPLAKTADVLGKMEPEKEDELNHRLGIDNKLKKQILDELIEETSWGDPKINLQAKLSLLIVFPEETQRILASINLDQMVQNRGANESFYKDFEMLFDLDGIYQIDPDYIERFKQAHPTAELIGNGVLDLENTPTGLDVKLLYMYALTKFLSGQPVPDPENVIEQTQQALQDGDIDGTLFLELAYGLVRVKPELKSWIAEQLVKREKSYTAEISEVLNAGEVIQLGILKFFMSPDSTLSPRGTMMIPKKTQVRVAPPLPPRSLAA